MFSTYSTIFNTHMSYLSTPIHHVPNHQIIMILAPNYYAQIKARFVMDMASTLYFLRAQKCTYVTMRMISMRDVFEKLVPNHNMSVARFFIDLLEAIDQSDYNYLFTCHTTMCRFLENFVEKYAWKKSWQTEPGLLSRAAA